MSCILRIIGKELEPDQFVAELKNLRPHKISYKGQPKFKTKPDGKKLDHSSVSFVVSDAAFEDFRQQIIDATDFLKRYKDDLKTIAITPGIEYATLDFGVSLATDKFTMMGYFVPDMLRLMSDLGIGLEVSLYQQGKSKPSGK